MNPLAKQILVVTLFVCGLSSAPARAQHDAHGHDNGHEDNRRESKAPTALPPCPIMGEPVNLAVSTVTPDGPVFFCCQACVPKYQANPSKYAAKVAAQRSSLAQRHRVQVTCPVSKEVADQKISIERDGKKVFFCCKGCVGKYQANPAQYASALANSYTYQTKCPVMGGQIDPQAYITTPNGTRIYYCCKACDKKFFENPQKYAPNLVAQGFTVNAKEMQHGADRHDRHDLGSHDHGGHDHD